MTSRNFGQFFDSPSPIVTHFITKALVLSSKILDPLPPFDRDVIYGRPLFEKFGEIFRTFLATLMLDSYICVCAVVGRLCAKKQQTAKFQVFALSSLCVYHSLDWNFWFLNWNSFFKFQVLLQSYVWSRTLPVLYLDRAADPMTVEDHPRQDPGRDPGPRNRLV